MNKFDKAILDDVVHYMRYKASLTASIPVKNELLLIADSLAQKAHPIKVVMD